MVVDVHAEYSVSVSIPSASDGHLKVYIARESSNGEQFIQPLRDIWRVLGRLEVVLKKLHAMARLCNRYSGGRGNYMRIYALALVPLQGGVDHVAGGR